MICAGEEGKESYNFASCSYNMNFIIACCPGTGTASAATSKGMDKGMLDKRSTLWFYKPLVVN